MVARAGSLVLIAVDTAMIGHAGAAELAAYGIALAPMVPLLLIGIGFVTGTVVLVSEALGAKRQQECGTILRVSLTHGILFGALLVAALHAGETILLATGQSPELASAGGVVVAALGWGMPAVLLHVSTSFFLEALNRTTAGMVVMLVANLVNAVGNWLVLFGPWAPLGAEGAAWITTAVRWLALAALLSYLLIAVPHRNYGLFSAAPIKPGRRLLRLGMPMGLTMGLESSAFTVMLIFAGWLGPVALGAFQIGYSLIGLPFMCALGFSTAASVRVAHAMGRGDRLAAQRAGWTAAGLGALVTGMIGVAYMLLPLHFAAIYSDETAVLALAGPTVIVAGLVLVPDACQAVLMGALRGQSDVWPPAALFMVAFWGVMVPVGYWVGVKSYGAPGLMAAICIGCIVAAVMLAARFYRRGTRMVHPVKPVAAKIR